MLPRYTDTAKVWFVLLILSGFFFLVFNIRQVRDSCPLERLFFLVVILNFLWITFCFYFNGEPGQGSAFLWGRHFYMLFMIPLFFLFRKIEISDRSILLTLFVSVAVSLIDILIDLSQGTNHRIQGMNPNAFGPIQLCLSGILLFYFVEKPGKLLRRIALAGVLIGLATVVFSQSKNTWMTLTAVSAIFAFYFARSLPLWKRVSFVICLLVLLSASYLLPIVKVRVDHGLNSVSDYYGSSDYRDNSRRGSFGTRMELWKTGWKIFLENPLTGVGVGGFQVMAKANSERYQVNDIVHRFKYVHNQYLAALATRGIPGLILFLLVILIPLYIAISTKSEANKSEQTQLSITLICLTYLIGCLAEDHFEGKSAIMFTGVMIPLLLARISRERLKPKQESCP